MNLRGKTLVIMAIIILILTLSFFIVSQIVFTSSSTESENNYTNLVLKNTVNSLNNDLESLNNTVKDWSNWDDAYNFVSGNNPNFVSKSLTNNTFSRINVNLIIFKDSSGKIVYGKAYNLKNNTEIQLPDNIQAVVTNNSLNLSRDENGGVSGVAIINGTPVLLAAKPILKSSGEGPAKGTLIMGRILDQDELKSLSDNGIVTVQRYKTVIVNSDFEKAKSALLNGSDVYINIVDADSIAGYTILKGVTGEPTVILKVELPRFIYKNYENAIFYLILSLIIVGLIAAGVITYYLDKNVLYRLDKIINSVTSIGNKNDFSARVPVLGDDELSDLSVSVNKMLESLQESNCNLQKGEERYRAIFENTGTAMIIINQNMDIKLVNNQFQQITGYLKSETENKKKLHDFILKESLDKINKHRNFREFKDKNQLNSYEIGLIHKNNEVRDFFATRGFIPGTENVLISLIDITEHKRAEDQIKASLKEKEVLLREIHHRVKNNLQIVSTLLALQSDEVEDEKILQNYKESENRIQSIALIHEKMYQSEDLSNIDFSGYITSLINDIFFSYGVSLGEIETEIDVPEYVFSIETSIPLGLIINEIISNSLKYAFKDINNPKITLKLRFIGENKFKLDIGDNGIGFPEDIDYKNTTSLGLQLVNALVEQIEGALELKKDIGTHFEIIFRETEYKKRI
ncbi:CHASE4 domain-containing protein [Methanobacterium sp. ACI-7]|uniref:CHASE4 domain-containing protein n=1 Tax=unclassified Methanobacterium TaxID=2627676 RepID=UPI0039C1F7F7